MKKNLITRKFQNTYYYYFLPLIECILTLKMMHNDDLVLNQTSLADYFDLERHTIADFLKQAEIDGLIIFDKKVRKIDDKTLDFALRRYILPTASEDSKFYSKLQEYINKYMTWTPTFGDRLDFYTDYLQNLDIESAKSIKALEKEERAKMYLQKYSWTTKKMDKINSLRPEALRSKYLVEGRLRESNRLCATLNPEKEHEAKLFATDLNYRYILLEEFFGTKEFIECDTIGSIYRLSYNLVHDELLNDDVDIYHEFWNLAGFTGDFDKITRDALKQLCMIIFMSNGKKNGYNSLLVLKDDSELTKKELERKDILKYMTRTTGLSARDFLDKLEVAMKQFIGVDKFLEEEIFIHESNLHLLILDLCAEQKIQVINVYDGFYFKKEDMNTEKYNQLYRQATLMLKKLENAEV